MARGAALAAESRTPPIRIARDRARLVIAGGRGAQLRRSGCSTVSIAERSVRGKGGRRAVVAFRQPSDPIQPPRPAQRKSLGIKRGEVLEWPNRAAC